MTLTEYLELVKGAKEIPRIHCVNGVHLHISRMVTLGEFSKNSFKIVAPSIEIEEIKQFAANSTDLTNSAYYYVPNKLVQEILDAQGGICLELSLLKGK